MEIHPEVPEGTPDFRLARGGKRVYVEAKTVGPESDPFHRRPNEQDALNKLNTLKSSHFRTAVTFPNVFTEDEIDRVEIGFDIGSHYVHPISITGRMLKQIGTSNDPLLGKTGSAKILCAYLSGRTNAETDSREPVQIVPRWNYINDRRNADRFGIIIAFQKNTFGHWSGFTIWLSSNIEIDIEYAYIVPRGAESG